MIRALGAGKRGDTACRQDCSSSRTCIVTRAPHPPEDLIRFVEGPDGRIVPDIARKLPGRGVWVTCLKETVESAVRSRAFARALRRKVDVDDGLADLVDQLLVRRAQELFSICNKAGLVACGSGKVNSWLEAGASGALIQAADASPDGLAKVARKYRAIRAATGKTPVEVTLLTISELSLAIGRANVVHAALSEGRAATNFLAAVGRVAKYRAARSEAPAFTIAGEASEKTSDAIRNTGKV